MSVKELWDLYDKNRIPLGIKVFKGEKLPKSQYHVIIHSWIRRKSDGKFLISKRAQSIFWGGFWQPTGGSVQSGETSREAAKREVKEELGIDLSDNQDDVSSKLLFTYNFSPAESDNPSFFLDCWLFECEYTDWYIKYQPEEVSDSSWASFDEIIEMWKKGAFMPFEQTWLPYFTVLQHALNAPQTIQSLKFWGVQQLKNSDNSQVKNTPELDSLLLLSYVLNKPKDFLLVHAKDKAGSTEAQSNSIVSEYGRLLNRRLTGEPVAYITQSKDFWQDSFFVTPDVLIPKPDTELLVEHAISILKELVQNSSLHNKSPLKIADICTGSGCIVISLLKELFDFCKMNGFPVPIFKATDISKEALLVAKKNAENLLSEEQKDKLIFLQEDLGSNLCKTGVQFDLIVSNPPYVPTETAVNLLLDGRKEPLLALDGGLDGLDIIKKLIPQVWSLLKKGGIFLVETGEYNASQTRELLKDCGFDSIVTYSDINGQPRLTKAVKP